MTVVNLEKYRENNIDKVEELLVALRLHDQMISCLNFVVEKVNDLHADSEDFGSLYCSLEIISRKRKEIYEQLIGQYPANRFYSVIE